MCFKTLCNNCLFIVPVLFGALLPAMSACTVLEKRSNCPCCMFLDMSDPVNYGSDSLVVNLSGPGFGQSLRFGRDGYAAGALVRVPRSQMIGVSAVEKSLEKYCSEKGVLIPVGQQCPVAYMTSGVCDSSEEEVIYPVRLCKNYCGVSLSFESKDSQQYDMKVQGNVCGYDPYGVPLSGSFGYSPDFDDQSRCYFRLPRQVDGSLTLEISPHRKKYEPLGVGDDTEEKTQYLSLGAYILQSGYDWTKQDLDDILIRIDFASATVVISIDGWSNEEIFDIVI